jgi:hypothetical protein
MAKFSGFRTFKLGKTIEEVVQYLTTSLAVSFKELQAGLVALNFEDNFQTQTLSVFIPAGTTVTYPHNLGVIPSKRLIVKADGYTIDDSATPWTASLVYFRNQGPTDINATIILMR